MKAAAKRFLNVATLIATLYLAILIWLMVSGGAGNWVKFIIGNFVPLSITYILILIINYVSFGKITIWHKNISNQGGV